MAEPFGINLRLDRSVWRVFEDHIVEQGVNQVHQNAKDKGYVLVTEPKVSYVTGWVSPVDEDSIEEYVDITDPRCEGVLVIIDAMATEPQK